MNKTRFFSLFTALLICISVLFTGCGCSNQDDTSAENTFIGTWQLVDENGNNHTLFSYVFENEKQVYMAMDNVAYGAEYTLSFNASGKPTIATQLYYNLNGTYVYEFSDNGNKVTLTEDGNANGNVITMVKIDDYNFMPDAPENPEIDQNIVGVWKDKNGTGITYEIFDNGTLIYNNYEVMITYAQYSAKDGTLNISYKMGTEVTDNYNYSISNDVLTIDGIEFVKE